MKSNNSLVKSSICLTAMIVLIKVAGFIKQVVVAYFYGSSIDTDLFFLAYGFENTVISILFSSLQITTVIIYLDELKKSGRKNASEFISKVIYIFTSFALFVGIFIFICSNQIASLLAPSYSEDLRKTLSGTIELFSIVTIFSPITTTLSSVLNAEKQYVKARLSTLITNLVDIAIVVLFASTLGIAARNYSFIISTILNAVMLVFMTRNLIRIRFLSAGKDARITKLIKLTLPIMMGNGATILMTMVDRIISSYLDSGGVSALDYSGSIYSILISFVSTALATILTTYFAEFASEKEYKALVEKFIKISRLSLTVMTLVCVIVLCCSYDIVAIIFQRGQFTSENTRLVSYACKGYVIAAIFVTVKDIAIRLLYANEKTQYPFYASIISGIINICTSVVLMRRFGVLGITLGTAFAEFCATILCIFYISKSFETFNQRDFYVGCIPIIISGIITYLVSYLMYSNLVGINMICRIVIVGLLGVSVYSALMMILRVKEFETIILYLKTKLCSSKR